MTATSQLKAIRSGLVGQLDPKVVDELLNAYTEAKRNYYAGGLRLSAVEGGRFCEATYRLLQQAAKLPMTPIGKQLKTEDIERTLTQLPIGTFPDSIRLHIPRGLRVVYDVRNNRDAAHLADGIDPNIQDATLVVSVLDWILAEFVRLYHNVTADAAQAIVESLVTRRAPGVQAFGDFLKILNPELRVSDYVLLLLYHCGAQGASVQELTDWVRPTMRRNLGRTLRRLEHEKAFLHTAGTRIYLTATGVIEVERRRLYELPE